MPEQWLTVNEAAAAMKVHPRTIERRIAAGKIDSRRDVDGLLEVLITIADPPPQPEPAATVSDPFEAVREMADRQVDIAAGSASALVRIAHEQVMRAENQLVHARQEASRYRRESQMALGLVAVMVVGSIVAVAWGTSAITTAQGNTRTADKTAAMTVEAAQASIRAADQAAEATVRATEKAAAATVEAARDSVRESHAALERAEQQRDAAVISRARIEGELATYRSEPAVGRTLAVTPTTTQPSNLLDRVANWFVGDRTR